MKQGIVFGAMAPSLAKQLRGIQFARQTQSRRNLLTHWQRDADAITRLAVRGLLPEAETRRARLRLLKLIAGAALSGEAKP